MAKNSATSACPRRGSSQGTPAACGVHGSSVTSHATSSARCESTAGTSRRPQGPADARTRGGGAEGGVDGGDRGGVRRGGGEGCGGGRHARILRRRHGRRNGPFGLSCGEPGE